MSLHTPWHFEGAIRSATGNRRPNNQDSGTLASNLALVADGVGGCPGGDIASAMVTRFLGRYLYTRRPASDLQDLRDAVALANQNLTSFGQRFERYDSMATTLSGVVQCGNGLALVHIGDSRVYVQRGDKVRQLSRDDSLIQDLLDQGLITPDQAAEHELRNLLTHCLSSALSDLDFLTLKLFRAQIGDRWIICTDGISRYLSQARFDQLCVQDLTPDDLADRLMDAAHAVSKDNLSVVVADICASQRDIPPSYAGAATAVSFVDLPHAI